jgi:glutaredoxin
MTRSVPAIVLAAVVVTVAGSLGCGQGDDSRVLASARRLVAFLVGDAPASSAGAAGSEAGSVAGSGERQAVVIEGGEFSSLEGDASAQAEVPFYSFVDSSGAARMVRGLYSVPERYRGSARRISKASMPVINRYEAKTASSRSVVAYQAPYNPNRKEVLLYSAEWCGACRKARAFLDSEGVNYDLLDIDADPRAKAEVRRILGSVRIPLLDVGGTYVSGFAPGEIRRALGKAG